MLDIINRYPEYEYTLACTQIILFMIGMGAMLSVHEFTRVIRQPRYLILGLVYNIVCVPALAVAINYLSGVGPGIAIGLVLASLMPGGSMSKVFTYLGRGNIALSITLSACATAATIVTVPLLLRVLAAGYIPDEFEMPAERVAKDVGLFLALPLAVGMLLARLAPARRKLLSRWCVRIGWVFVVLIVVGSLGSGRIRPGDYGWRAPLAIIFFCIIAQQASMVPFYIMRWPRPERLAIGIETTMRNMNLALLLKAILFPEGSGSVSDTLGHGVIFVVLFYAAVALIVGTLLALNHLRLARLDKARGAVPHA
jgi:BASS family bile acid:Na+ symporter